MGPGRFAPLHTGSVKPGTFFTDTPMLTPNELAGGKRLFDNCGRATLIPTAPENLDEIARRQVLLSWLWAHAEPLIALATRAAKLEAVAEECKDHMCHDPACKLCIALTALEAP